MLVNLDAVLKPAQAGGYAVGLFNTTDTDMLEAAIGAAEEMRSPIIIGTAEVLLPSGELSLIAPSVIENAGRASVPVVVHYDHGLTFDRCMEALKLGFSSVMYDGSAKDYDTNIAETREIVKIAHSFGATVEGEIGHVGNADTEDNSDADGYTTVKEARDYLEATGVDALAIAIGTAHGVYKKTPTLRIDRLDEITAVCDCPLVLHGGSGTPDDQMKTAIAHGITKINIFSDVVAAMNTGLKEKLNAMANPATWPAYVFEDARNRMKCVVREKLETFGSAGRV